MFSSKPEQHRDTAPTIHNLPIMPNKNEEEIKELLRCVKEGIVTTGPEFGYKQVCDVVPCIRKKCQKDSRWRDLFISWWCRYKNRENAKQSIVPFEDLSEEEPDPVVPVTAKRRGVRPPIVEECDQPRPYKPPKQRVENQPLPKPAPSPPSPERPKYDFSNCHFSEVDCTAQLLKQEREYLSDLFGPSSPASASNSHATRATKSPAKSPAKSAKSPDKSRATSPAKSSAATLSPEQKIMSTLTPEEKAYALISYLKSAPETFPLEMGGAHGIDYWKFPWACTQNVLHVSYFIEGASSAWVEDGHTIHVEFPRRLYLRGIEKAFKFIFRDKLTNPTIIANFNQFVKFLENAIKTTATRDTVSIDMVSCTLLTSTHACVLHHRSPASFQSLNSKLKTSL